MCDIGCNHRKNQLNQMFSFSLWCLHGFMFLHLITRFGDGYSVKVWLSKEISYGRMSLDCLQLHFPGTQFKVQIKFLVVVYGRINLGLVRTVCTCLDIYMFGYIDLLGKSTYEDPFYFSLKQFIRNGLVMLVKSTPNRHLGNVNKKVFSLTENFLLFLLLMKLNSNLCSPEVGLQCSH